MNSPTEVDYFLVKVSTNFSCALNSERDQLLTLKITAFDC